MSEDNKEFNFNFDLSNYADVLDHEKLAELWAKVEVAKIMMEQTSKLTRQIYADLEFYKMASEYKKSNSDGD